MRQIISVHSFRRGTGKTMITANLAALCASAGWRVGMLDFNPIAPSLHFLFGTSSADTESTFNDFLAGHCPISKVALGLPLLGGGEPSSLKDSEGGALWLIPAIMQSGRFPHVRPESHMPLEAGVEMMMQELELDLLFIDNYAGIADESLQMLALCDALLLVAHLDKQDYRGTGILIELARELKVPHMWLLLNQIARAYSADQVRAAAAKHYAGLPLLAVLHHAVEVLALMGSDLVVRRHPTHILTQQLVDVAKMLLVHAAEQEADPHNTLPDISSLPTPPKQ